MEPLGTPLKHRLGDAIPKLWRNHPVLIVDDEDAVVVVVVGDDDDSDRDCYNGAFDVAVEADKA